MPAVTDELQIVSVSFCLLSEMDMALLTSHPSCTGELLSRSCLIQNGDQAPCRLISPFIMNNLGECFALSGSQPFLFVTSL